MQFSFPRFRRQRASTAGAPKTPHPNMKALALLALAVLAAAGAAHATMPAPARRPPTKVVPATMYMQQFPAQALTNVANVTYYKKLKKQTFATCVALCNKDTSESSASSASQARRTALFGACRPRAPAVCRPCLGAWGGVAAEPGNAGPLTSRIFCFTPRRVLHGGVRAAQLPVPAARRGVGHIVADAPHTAVERCAQDLPGLPQEAWRVHLVMRRHAWVGKQAAPRRCFTTANDVLHLDICY